MVVLFPSQQQSSELKVQIFGSFETAGNKYFYVQLEDWK